MCLGCESLERLLEAERSKVKRLEAELTRLRHNVERAGHDADCCSRDRSPDHVCRSEAELEELRAGARRISVSALRPVDVSMYTTMIVCGPGGEREVLVLRTAAAWRIVGETEIVERTPADVVETVREKLQKREEMPPLALEEVLPGWTDYYEALPPLALLDAVEFWELADRRTGSSRIWRLFGNVIKGEETVSGFPAGEDFRNEVRLEGLLPDIILRPVKLDEDGETWRPRDIPSPESWRSDLPSLDALRAIGASSLTFEVEVRDPETRQAVPALLDLSDGITVLCFEGGDRVLMIGALSSGSRWRARSRQEPGRRISPETRQRVLDGIRELARPEVRGEVLEALNGSHRLRFISPAVRAVLEEVLVRDPLRRRLEALLAEALSLSFPAV